ncbi:Rod binding protein [Desulfacinum hydrothermale DSM 13146]|uniref:Rod binding protein n=1 Tax=Desulfacinum hydrothermale DSM 13146 TaxID=1121390 RepID=A0A1W1X7A7_9BACT|nr:rod-binding protein [Desulfacinum hydrothermale]SMC19391.1 Rod binding protein [Desulfacinum hydrothermale DSM 13146]
MDSVRMAPVTWNPERTADSVDHQKKRLRQACRDFESLLNAHMFKSMRRGILRAERPEHAQSLYEAMFDEALAKECAEQGAVGLGDLLYRQLEPLIEASSASPATGSTPKET